MNSKYIKILRWIIRIIKRKTVPKSQIYSLRVISLFKNKGYFYEDTFLSAIEKSMKYELDDIS